MPKYKVYVTATAYKYAGEYEAEDEDEAVEMCEADTHADTNFSLTMGNDFDIGDHQTMEAELIE